MYKQVLYFSGKEIYTLDIIRKEEWMPDVSVIIPVYNAEEYLASCLDSVLGQTLKNIEIICVNDGSKDGSLKILKEYRKKDKRIKIIDLPNGGPSIARNRGMAEA